MQGSVNGEKNMEEQIAETLISELKRQWGVVPLNKERFLEPLLSTDVNESSSRFYEVLPDNQQHIPDIGSEHYFSLRRVLRNKNAKGYKMALWKELYEAFASLWGFYSSDIPVRRIRANKDIVGMMAECKTPFSLFGKLRTEETIGAEDSGNMLITTRPVLIIPGIGAYERGVVEGWEKANTISEQEKRLLPFF